MIVVYSGFFEGLENKRVDTVLDLKNKLGDVLLFLWCWQRFEVQPFTCDHNAYAYMKKVLTIRDAKYFFYTDVIKIDNFK